MNLSDHERLPGFKERAALAEVEVRLAIATDKSIQITKIASLLQVPPRVALQWIGKITARLGVTKIRMVATGLPS